MDPVNELIANARARKNGLPPPAERKDIRTNAGVSLRAMAQAVGVSQMAIFHWEQGSFPRELEHLERYKRALEGLSKIP